MPDLLILGINAHAVEMADMVNRINEQQNTWNLVGFVSPNESRVGDMLVGFPVFDKTDALKQYPTAFVVPEYEWPHKSEIPRHQLISLIDPTVFVSKSAHIGQGCVIYPNCYVGAYAALVTFSSA